VLWERTTPDGHTHETTLQVDIDVGGDGDTGYSERVEADAQLGVAVD
jgi:hypothetical protein